MLLPTLMGKQDDWIRKTVRLPVELHEQLARAAKLSSMNAEIVARLEQSFADHPTKPRDISSSLLEIIQASQFLDDEDRAKIIDLIVSIGAKLSHRTR
jgi:hypothetical protein